MTSEITSEFKFSLNNHLLHKRLYITCVDKLY